MVKFELWCSSTWDGTENRIEYWMWESNTTIILSSIHAGYGRTPEWLWRFRAVLK
jgi:hypothetical protein